MRHGILRLFSVGIDITLTLHDSSTVSQEVTVTIIDTVTNYQLRSVESSCADLQSPSHKRLSMSHFRDQEAVEISPPHQIVTVSYRITSSRHSIRYQPTPTQVQDPTQEQQMKESIDDSPFSHESKPSPK